MNLKPRLALLTLSAGYMLAVAHGAEWRPLFDGTFDGWKPWLDRPHASTEVTGLARSADGNYTEALGWDRDPLQVFSIVERDGGKVMRFSGQVFGYLVTTESFGNFHVRLQFQWGEKRWPPRADRVRDSGLLYFIHTGPARSYGTWPGSLELQIQEGDTGDLYALLSKADVRVRHTGFENKLPLLVYDPAAEPILLEQEGAQGNRGIKSVDHEKPHGQWNTVELVCFGSTAIHIVNGHVVLRVTNAQVQPDGPALDRGPIALQTEGAEVFFRNIEIRSIDDIPPEFAAAKTGR